MHILTDGLIAFLAAVGLTGLIWALAGVLVRRGRPALRAFVVLCAAGEGESLDWGVYTACRAAASLGREAQVVVLDCGLSEAGRQRAAVWEENNDCVTVCLPSQLEQTIT